MVLDIWLQNSPLDGMGLLDAIQESHPDLPVVMISGHGNIETAVNAIKRGAFDFIEKPFKSDRLLVMVERALEAARLRRENEELRPVPGRVRADRRSAGHDPAAPGDRARRADRQPRAVLRPAGSGKEVAARMLHPVAPRASGRSSCSIAPPCIPTGWRSSCSAPKHGDGTDGRARSVSSSRPTAARCCWTRSPTCRWRPRARSCARCRSRRFERVGGKSRVEVDVRVIAATNRDLQAEIVAGQFREDLFYRLNVVPMRVPALARAARRHSGAGSSISCAASAETAGLPARESRRRHAGGCCRPMIGRAMCGNCATWSIGC